MRRAFFVLAVAAVLVLAGCAQEAPTAPTPKQPPQTSGEERGVEPASGNESVRDLDSANDTFAAIDDSLAALE